MGSSLSLYHVAAVASVPVAALLLVVGLIGGQQLLNRLNYYRSGCNIPRVPEKFFVGSIRAKEIFKMQLEDREKYGKVFIFSLFSTPMIIVSDPDLAQHIIAK